MSTFFFACLSCSDVWLREVEADYRERMFFTKFMHGGIGSVETFGTAALPSVPDFIQLVVPGSDPELHQASGVRS